MFSLSAITMLLVSVIAFSYANLFNIISFTLWIVNNRIIIFLIYLHRNIPQCHHTILSAPNISRALSCVFGVPSAIRYLAISRYPVRFAYF